MVMLSGGWLLTMVVGNEQWLMMVIGDGRRLMMVDGS